MSNSENNTQLKEPWLVPVGESIAIPGSIEEHSSENDPVDATRARTEKPKVNQLDTVNGGHKHMTHVLVDPQDTRVERINKLYQMEEEYNNPALLRRKVFVLEFIKDFKGTEAAFRTGNYTTRDLASRAASKMLNESYCQLLMSLFLEEVSEDILCSRNEVIAGLKSEANNFDDDSSHSARVAAWGKLAKIYGMEIDRSMNLNVAATPTELTEKAKEGVVRTFNDFVSG